MRMAHGTKMLKPQAISRVVKIFLGCYDIAWTMHNGGIAADSGNDHWRDVLVRHRFHNIITPRIAEPLLEQLENTP